MHELPFLDELVGAILKCRKEKILDHAKILHSQIRELGLDTNSCIENFLVPMFVDCGSLSDAQQAFDRLSSQNEHSWTSLISGYVESGHVQHALNLYLKMLEGNVSASCYTVLAIIKAYANVGNVEGGRCAHSQAVISGFDQDVFVGSGLVHLYSKSGLLMDAWQVLDNLTVRSTVCWTSIISGYAEHGPADAAFLCYERMQSERLLPDATTYVCILTACGNSGLVLQGRDLHATITLHGWDDNCFVTNSLIDMYAKCGVLHEAETLSKLCPRNVLSWTSLISGYAEHGPFEVALECFEKMRSEGIFPDAVTFASVLKACGSIGAIERGRETHQDIPQSVMKEFSFVGNAVVDMYIKCGSLTEAQEAFDKLPERACAPWNALVAGYANSGTTQQVLTCVERMEHEGVSVAAGIYISMLKSCGSTGSIDEARELHAAVVLKGFDADLSVGNTLVDVYAKKVAVAEAQQVFISLQWQDVVSWTALIAAYTEGAEEERAIDSFTQMQVEAVSPNSVTAVCVLKSCSNIGAYDKGQEIHGDIVLRGFENDISVCNTLIDMYGAAGFLLDSQDLFSRMPRKDVVSWNALIKAYGSNHDGEMAVQCFEEMQNQDVEPDVVTFTCVLSACSRAKLLRKGQEIFNLMREKYGISPTIDHYTCIVDLHVKSGCLWEVEGFLDSGSNFSLWMALLTACKIFVEVDLGLRCFQELVQINPEKAAPYMLMAKTFEAASMWEEAQHIEELRKEAGAKKQPATALIEVHKRVHEFVVGDDQSLEVSAMLDTLTPRLKKHGYVPIVNVHT
ncbi:hypothetical protein GOP47_0026890 [Adiantum capillus-veneris]|nr:hypothetical protein GOP47_0026890 [Adiantum capillus-veneris]